MRWRTALSSHRIRVKRVDLKVEFCDKFLDGFLDRSQSPFSVDLTGHDLPESLPQVFKRHVFVFSDPCNICNAFLGDRGGQMIHEQTGFLARPITHVPSVKVHPGAVRSEKLLDRLTLLVGSVNLRLLRSRRFVRIDTVPISGVDSRICFRSWGCNSLSCSSVSLPLPFSRLFNSRYTFPSFTSFF